MSPVEPILAEARAGSTAALGELLELCRQYMLSIANQELDSRVSPKAGASDVVQDAFLEAQRIFARFQGGTKEELLSWLRAILINKLDDTERRYFADKRQVAREVFFDTPPVAGVGPSPSALISAQEEQTAVRQAVDRLPEQYRQVIMWRQWDELPFDEIARRLDKSVDAARMVWWRALEKLEQELGETP